MAFVGGDFLIGNIQSGSYAYTVVMWELATGTMITQISHERLEEAYSRVADAGRPCWNSHPNIELFEFTFTDPRKRSSGLQLEECDEPALFEKLLSLPARFIFAKVTNNVNYLH